MSAKKLEARISEDFNGKRFDKALAQIFPDFSRARLQDWIKQEKALLDGNPAQPSTRVKFGQFVELSVEFDPIAASEGQAIPLEVVFEDEHLLVINKPSGLVVHPGAGNPTGTLMNGLLHYYPELRTVPRAGIIHRLDKDTTGLILIARNLFAHNLLVKSLEGRLIRREYRAICNDRLVAGDMIDAPIGRDPNHRTRMKVISNGKPAVTNYRVLARFRKHSFIGIRLESGRTHQIRVHMSYVNCPLVGDPLYGGRLRVPSGASNQLTEVLQSFKRQALHAFQLEFKHPNNGELLEFEAPLPLDLLSLLNALSPESNLNYSAMRWPE
ncbi:MAG: 23S rRNA pseudouridine(1911/1915/1917) synthase RluD [Pseudomonadota bacterium]|nr:23S rRNA pseudouridine(1911/1915/1917) synthase RluD [Pseudomonadota bacterium]